eukprot:UN11996
MESLPKEFKIAGRVYGEYRVCEECALTFELENGVNVAVNVNTYSACDCPTTHKVSRVFYDIKDYELPT